MGLMSILIVDDSEDNQILLRAILRNAGYTEVLTAASARDAFDHLGMDGLASCETGIDLILMDIMMPDVDGIEACRRIKAYTRLRDIPIIMVTALTEVNYIEASFEAGAMDYVTKPVNKIEVLSRIRSALSLKRETEARKCAYVELEEKNQELARESLVKSQILSTATHELKTPLTSIVGYAKRMLQNQETVGPLNERQQRYVEAIQESSYQLTILINDLLDTSRIEAGRLEVTPTQLQVQQKVEDVVRAMQTQFEEKQIRVVLDIPSQLCPIYVDHDRCTQIITNLLGNACKYSSVGASVTITAAENGEFVQVDVADTGMGISEEDQLKLFTKFFRADNTATRAESGTGLGLFITKQLIQAHGGAIWVKSEVGTGSIFSFTLPRADVDLTRQDMPVETRSTGIV